MNFLYELLNFFFVVSYTAVISFIFHLLYHKLKWNRKFKETLLCKVLFSNYFYDEKENKVYSKNYSKPMVFDPLIAVTFWFCAISYLFFSFNHFQSLMYGVLTIIIGYLLHLKFSAKRTRLKKSKIFVYLKKIHNNTHYKYNNEKVYTRYKKLVKILVEKEK